MIELTTTETTATANEVPVPNWIVALLGVIYRIGSSLRNIAKAAQQDWHWMVTRPLKERAARRQEHKAQRRQARDAYFSAIEANHDDEEPPVIATSIKAESEADEPEDTTPLPAVDPEEDDDDRGSGPPPERPRRPWLNWLALVLIVAIVAVIWASSNRSGGTRTADGRTNEATQTVSTKPTTAKTWRLKYMDTAGNRLVAAGVGAIRDAKTNAEAEEAAQVWLDKIKSDPRILKAASVQFLQSDVDTSTLFDKDGWATDKAVLLVSRLQMKLASSRIVADEAPTDGTNSGMDGNRVVSSRQAGISGDRRAIRIELTFTDGHREFVWIMWRCGNFVTMKAKFPVGKTERQPKPHLSPKNWRDDPYPRGNAPRGGGPNADPGPGPLTPRPSSPPAVYTPPAPPPAASTPPVDSTPDQQPSPPDDPAVSQDPPNSGTVPTQ